MIAGALLFATLAHAQDVDTDADGLPDRYDPCPNDLTNAIVNDTCADATPARPTSTTTPPRSTAPAVAQIHPSPATPVVPTSTEAERARESRRYLSSRRFMWAGLLALPGGVAAVVAGAQGIPLGGGTISTRAVGLLTLGATAVVASPAVTATGIYGQRTALSRAHCSREGDGGDLIAIGTIGATYLLPAAALVGYPYSVVHAFPMDRDARNCGLR